MIEKPTQTMKLQEWFVLRNLVLEVAYSQNLDLFVVNDTDQHELNTLIRSYLASRDQNLLNAGARLVARLKPNVSVEIAESHPWLVLENS
jgi:hypothetical protein